MERNRDYFYNAKIGELKKKKNVFNVLLIHNREYIQLLSISVYVVLYELIELLIINKYKKVI